VQSGGGEGRKALAGGAPPEETHDEKGRLVRLELSSTKPGNRVHKEWDNTVLGHVTLEEGRVTGNVNSSRRADRLRREVAKRLGKKAELVKATVQGMDDLWAEARRRRAERGAEPEPEPEPEVAPADRAAIANLAAQHWERWLDERIPALGNKTPRQAAKTPLGRERLEALFSEYAWRSESTPATTIMRPDIPALRAHAGAGVRRLRMRPHAGHGGHSKAGSAEASRRTNRMTPRSKT
jgi:hypothetical protein